MKRQWNLMSLALAAAVALPTFALAQAPATAQPSPASAKSAASADSAFLTSAAQAGMAEVELGKLGVANATSSDVKQFAQRMVDDHSKANDELKALAAQKNVTLPAEVDAKHKAVHDKLAKSKGPAFDTAFMSQMVSDHQAAVSLFDRESKTGKDPETKAWAGKTLPTLQEHQKMATELHAKTGHSGK